MKKTVFIILSIVFANIVHAQDSIGLAVKTNLLNFLAKRPSLSIEKTFSKKYGLELSYGSGELNWGRYYKFDGLLLRSKIYTNEIAQNNIISFYGLYLGYLNKRITADNAFEDRTGFFSFGNNRDFKASSIRAGGNVGFLFIPKKRFLMESTIGLGYGRYFNIQTYNNRKKPSAYLDFQFSLSVGYSF